MRYWRRNRRSRIEEGSGGMPYRHFAAIYDELVGETAFECWRETFEQAVSRHGIEFESAADVACGTGLAARYLAERCRRVYAIDISREMLKVARRNVSAANVLFAEQSFTELALPEPVDLLTCNFDSLNYLTRTEDLAEAIRRFARSLSEGGHCVFDMNTARELEVEHGPSTMMQRVAGGFTIWESEWDAGTCTSTLTMTNVLPRACGLFTVTEEVHRERSYDAGFVTGLLREAGFTRTYAYDARGLTGVGSGTRRVLFVSRL